MMALSDMEETFWWKVDRVLRIPFVAIQLWWKTGPVRWYCRRFKSHQGAWDIILNRRGNPYLVTCRRCYAMGEFDMVQRTILFDD